MLSVDTSEGANTRKGEELFKSEDNASIRTNDYKLTMSKRKLEMRRLPTIRRVWLWSSFPNGVEQET